MHPTTHAPSPTTGRMCNFAHVRTPKGANANGSNNNGSDGAKKGPKQAQALAPRPPTLLRQLLGKELRRESSILLQTFRFLVDSSFLDAAEEEAEVEAEVEVSGAVAGHAEEGRHREEEEGEGGGDEEEGEEASDGAGAATPATAVGGEGEGEGAAGMAE